jgi:hypothetical protein
MLRPPVADLRLLPRQITVLPTRADLDIMKVLRMKTMMIVILSIDGKDLNPETMKFDQERSVDMTKLKAAKSINTCETARI